MSPVAWALRPLQRYADFNGRSPRSEYWWFALFQWIAYIVLFVVFMIAAVAASEVDQTPGAGFWIVLGLTILLLFGLFIPNLAVMVRRLHDQNLSGWYILLFFIPYIGGIIAIVFMCIRGTDGPNNYGADPFGSERHLERVFA